MRIIGEAQQQWAPLRRKYNLFVYRDAANSTTDHARPQLTSGELPLSNSTALQVADHDGEHGDGAKSVDGVDVAARAGAVGGASGRVGGEAGRHAGLGERRPA